MGLPQERVGLGELRGELAYGGGEMKGSAGHVSCDLCIVGSAPARPARWPSRPVSGRGYTAALLQVVLPDADACRCERVPQPGAELETVEEIGTPLVQFALRVMEAPSCAILYSVVVDEMVQKFGVRRSAVNVGQTIVAESGEGGMAPPWRFRISAKGEISVELEIEVDRSEDMLVIRQQFLDLVSVVRRALSHVKRFESESLMARRDDLTGLENRRSMELALETELHRAVATGRRLSLMMIDLDHFKAVNDSDGHAAGDEVLRVAAEFLRAHLRTQDRIARWGGDEFLVMMADLDGAQARVVAERLRGEFGSDIRARGATMSIGIADTSTLPANWDGRAATLISNADACLYAGKRAGRNRILVAQVA